MLSAPRSLHLPPPPPQWLLLAQGTTLSAPATPAAQQTAGTRLLTHVSPGSYSASCFVLPCSWLTSTRSLSRASSPWPSRFSLRSHFQNYGTGDGRHAPTKPLPHRPEERGVC